MQSIIIFCRRIAHAVRGLKYKHYKSISRNASHIAHAVRGLKFYYAMQAWLKDASHRSRGAWIEMVNAG